MSAKIAAAHHATLVPDSNPTLLPAVSENPCCSPRHDNPACSSESHQKEHKDFLRRGPASRLLRRYPPPYWRREPASAHPDRPRHRATRADHANKVQWIALARVWPFTCTLVNLRDLPRIAGAHNPRDSSAPLHPAEVASRRETCRRTAAWCNRKSTWSRECPCRRGDNRKWEGLDGCQWS